MGTVLASKIAADAAKLLFDTGYDRHVAATDHLNYINAGQIEAVRIKPDISVGNAAVVLEAGTKQSIAAADISLIKLTRNMGVSPGTTPGKVIRFVAMDALDKHNPNWHTDTASATVQMYMFDSRNPRNYYVYPQQPASGFGYVEKITSVKPTAIATIATAITIEDVYETALLNYDMYRTLSIDAKQSEAALKKAILHYQLFYRILTGKEITEDKINLGLIKSR